MVNADFKARAAIWMLHHVLVRIRMSAATPSGPGADLRLVLRRAFSICCLVGRSVRGPLKPSFVALSLSQKTISALAAASTAFPPSLAAKCWTHALARAMASA